MTKRSLFFRIRPLSGEGHTQWNGSLAKKSFQISHKLLSESDLTVVMYFPELALDIQKQFQKFRCSQVHDVDVA